MNNLSFFSPVVYNGITISDIFHNYNSVYKSIEDKYLLKEFSIKGSPRPESLSHSLYGSTDFYWVLLLINKIYDPYYDWIHGDNSVHEYTAQKYRNVGGPHKIAYHETYDKERFWNVIEYPKDSGLWYDKGDKIYKYVQYKGPMIPITNIEHELKQNELRRVIKIVRPQDIKAFVEDFFSVLENTNNGNN